MSNSLTNWFGNVKTKLAPKMPDILFWAGMTGVVGGTVMLCYASTKLPGIMSDYRDDLAMIDTSYDDEDPEKKKALRKARGKLIWTITKNYGFGFAVEVLSLISMYGGYSQVKTVSAELAAVCASTNAMLSSYRGRVKETIGEEDEEKLWLGGHDEQVKVITVNEDGTTTEEEQTRTVYDKDLPSIYARWFVFGEAKGAEPHLDYNKWFLEATETMFSNYLRARRVVFLNEIYEHLGIKHSLAGNRVGWIYDPSKGVGENRINLRIKLAQYRNEYGELIDAYMIDPDVQGIIDEKALSLGLLSD